MVLQLRSAADPSLIVDAAALWDQPERVLARFGAQADTDLLLALRRGAVVWPPLAPLLGQASPAARELDDDAVASLLGPAAEELAGAGIQVLWPASFGDGLKLQAVPTAAPERLTEAGFSLDALLEFRWRLTLGGELLDADEIAELAEAKRPLIRLRGRWLTLDPVLLAKLRRPPRTRMRAMEALGAVLAGTAEIDGETVTVVADGPFADFADQVARMAAAPPELAPTPGLEATLRPYQQRGLAWLAAMCDARARRLPGRRHGPRQDDPADRAAPAPPGGHGAGPDAGGLPGLAARQLGAGGRTGSPRTSRSAATTAADAHLRDLAADEIVLATYGVVLRATRRSWPGSAGAWWSPTRPSTSRTRSRAPPGHCATLPGAGPDRADRHPGGEPALRAVGDPGLDHTRAARPAERFRAGCAVPIERDRDPRGDRPARRAGARRSCCGAGNPTRASRRSCRPRPRPTVIVPLTAEQVTLYEAVVRETMAEIAERRGDRPARAGAQAAHRAEADLQPPRAVPEAVRGPLARAVPASSPAFDELLDVILAEGESMLVFTQYTQMARAAAAASGRRGIRSLFLHGGIPVRAPRGDGGRIPGRRGAGVPAVAEGGRHRPDPHPRRPMSCTTTAGGTRRSRTRPPTAPTGSGRTSRPGPPAHHRGHAGGPDRGAARDQTRPGRRGRRLRRGLDHRTVRRRARRAGLAAGRVDDRHGERASRAMGHTWWGRAWVDALEQRARLDPNRLPRGRDYARDGAVGDAGRSPRVRRGPGAGPPDGAPTTSGSGSGGSPTTSGTACST